MITTTTKPSKTSRTGGQMIEQISVSTIAPHPAQPREVFDRDKLKQLAGSIKLHGLLQPVLIRPMPSGKKNFQLVCGERRLRAAKAAGLKTIAAIVRVLPDKIAMTMLGVENLQRADLSPLEPARFFLTLRKRVEDGGAGMTIDEVTTQTGLDRRYVQEHIGLLDLPKFWLDKLHTGELGRSHVGALLPYRATPSILRAIKDDYVQNRWDWRTQNDFRTNTMAIASKLAGQVESDNAAAGGNGNGPADGNSNAGEDPVLSKLHGRTRAHVAVHASDKPKLYRGITMHAVGQLLLPYAGSARDLTAVRDHCNKLIDRLDTREK